MKELLMAVLRWIPLTPWWLTRRREERRRDWIQHLSRYHSGID